MTNIIKRNNGNTGLTTTRSVLPFGDWVDGVLQNALGRFFDDDLWRFDHVSTRGQIPVNIRETATSYEMEVMAPGLQKEDFDVNISNNVLTVSFNHQEEGKQEDKRGNYLRQEYRVTAFSRSFSLDDTVDADKISAQYNNGVLHLSLPKKEGAQQITRNIEIK